jgi:hypothetical protein
MLSRIILFVIVVACLALWPQGILAQTKLVVEVINSGEDSVGSRLAYKVKEDIRRSGGLRLTNIDEQRFRFRLTTMDAFKGGSSTIYGFTITLKNAGGLELFVRDGVGICGGTRVDDSAEDLVADIDRETDFLRKPLPK